MLAGLLTRLAAIPMIIDMIGALVTKLPILWGGAPLFTGEAGWWDFAHESRVDLAQLCGACSCSSSAPAAAHSTPGWTAAV